MDIMKWRNDNFHQLFKTIMWGLQHYNWFGEESGLVNLNWIFSKAVNHITSKLECLRDSASKRLKTFVGLTMVFTKVIYKLSQWENFAFLRKTLTALQQNLLNGIANSGVWQIICIQLLWYFSNLNLNFLQCLDIVNTFFFCLFVFYFAFSHILILILYFYLVLTVKWH